MGVSSLSQWTPSSAMAFGMGSHGFAGVAPFHSHQSGSIPLLECQHLLDPQFKTDDFRMYKLKVDECQERQSHNWKQCSFKHESENARRRDPTEIEYTTEACPMYHHGICLFGDQCPFSHGVHEQLLHPAKFRTTLCKRAGSCNRECCFFAHSTHELRPPAFEPSNMTRLRASQLMHQWQLFHQYTELPRGIDAYAFEAAFSAASFRAQNPEFSPGGKPGPGGHTTARVCAGIAYTEMEQVCLFRISEAMLRFQGELPAGAPYKPRMANDLAVALGLKHVAMGRGIRDLRLASAPTSPMFGGQLSLPVSPFGQMSLPQTPFGQFGQAHPGSLLAAGHMGPRPPQDMQHAAQLSALLAERRAASGQMVVKTAHNAAIGGPPRGLRINTGKGGGGRRPVYNIHADVAPHTVAQPAPLADRSNLAPQSHLHMGGGLTAPPHHLGQGSYALASTAFLETAASDAMALEPRLNPSAPSFDPAMRSTLDYFSAPSDDTKSIAASGGTSEPDSHGSSGGGTLSATAAHSEAVVSPLQVDVERQWAAVTEAFSSGGSQSAHWEHPAENDTDVKEMVSAALAANIGQPASCSAEAQPPLRYRTWGDADAELAMHFGGMSVASHI